MKSGSGLKTSGGALSVSGGSYQVGYGVRVGPKISGLAKTSAKTQPQGAIALALLHSLGKMLEQGKIHPRMHHAKLVNDFYKEHLAKYIKSHFKKGRGPRAGKMTIPQFIKMFSQTPIHAHDLWGPAYKRNGLKMMNLIGKQTGGSFWKKLKGAAKKAGQKMSQFFKGETKYKPSDLVKDLGAVGNTLGDILSVIPDPRAQKAAKLLKMGSKIAKPISGVLKKSGRGVPKRLPQYAMDFIQANPDDSKRMINIILGGSRLLVMSPPFSMGQVKLYKLLSSRRDLIDQAEALIQAGGGLYTVGARKRLRRNVSRCQKGEGPKVGSRAQVWHGNAEISHRGETIDMLIKNRNGRIVSKKRSASAKKTYAKRKKKLVPFRKKALS